MFEYVNYRYWKDRFTTLKLVSCQNCMSVGDAIREVDARSLITSDFLLITNPATICTSDLRPQIKAYSESFYFFLYLLIPRTCAGRKVCCNASFEFNSGQLSCTFARFLYHRHIYTSRQ
uniref:Uncharacterized protein n=1 Tax=Ascaris lumbricoides TaxID=6252 RepID=A0A0M3HLC9_ASCLU